MLLFYSRGQPGVVFDHMNYYVTFISQAQIEAVFGLDSQKNTYPRFSFLDRYHMSIFVLYNITKKEKRGKKILITQYKLQLEYKVEHYQ